MAKENDELDFIDALHDEERQRAILGLTAICVVVLPMLGIRGLALLVLMSIFFSSRKPGNTSFMVHFQKWFKEKLFPQISEKLAAELNERAKNESASIFSALKDSAQSFLLSKTTSVRAELAWAAFSVTMRPAYRDFYAFRTASVNMGSEEAPVFAVFIGFNQEWYLSPHIKLDFDDVSVLRMMENQ